MREDALDLLPFLLLFTGSWGIVNRSASSDRSDLTPANYQSLIGLIFVHIFSLLYIQNRMKNTIIIFDDDAEIFADLCDYSIIQRLQGCYSK